MPKCLLGRQAQGLATIVVRVPVRNWNDNLTPWPGLELCWVTQISAGTRRNVLGSGNHM